MAEVLTIKLFSPNSDNSNDDYVIVEPGSSAERIWRARGYSDKQVSGSSVKESAENTQFIDTLFPKKKGRTGRPKKVKDIGKTNYEKKEKTT